jgi:catechol 2,3-dioxygenase-like lactoylglutathione lyase family enzyme
MAFALGPLHHVQLAIPRGGEPECRAFWGDLLRMTEVEEPFAPARKAHPGILVEGLGELAAWLEGGGVEVTWDGEFPGHDRFYASDPFGNRLEFLEPRG